MTRTPGPWPSDVESSSPDRNVHIIQGYTIEFIKNQNPAKKRNTDEIMRKAIELDNNVPS